MIQKQNGFSAHERNQRACARSGYVRWLDVQVPLLSKRTIIKIHNGKNIRLTVKSCRDPTMWAVQSVILDKHYLGEH